MARQRGSALRMGLLAPLASHFFERGMRANLDTLKRLIEAQP